MLETKTSEKDFSETMKTCR